jgi:hypothetical protein
MAAPIQLLMSKFSHRECATISAKKTTNQDHPSNTSQCPMMDISPKQTAKLGCAFRPEENRQMKVFMLINGAGEFLCRKDRKIYTSKTDILNVIYYKYKANLQHSLEDKAYWDYRKIPIQDFKPTLCEISYRPIPHKEI